MHHERHFGDVCTEGSFHRVDPLLASGMMPSWQELAPDSRRSHRRCWPGPGCPAVRIVNHRPEATARWSDTPTTKPACMPDPLASTAARTRMLRRGRTLEVLTLAWNAVGIMVLAVAAARTRSVALAGFGLDSLIEIGASIVVLWELSGSGQDRQRRALRLIGGAFVVLAGYLAVQATLALLAGHHPAHGALGIIWTAGTAAVMFALAAGKARTGAELHNPVLQSEGRVTLVDGLLAVAVLIGVSLDAVLGWWWADPLAGYVIVFYAAREARTCLTR